MEMSIRVGRCFYNYGKRVDPTYPDHQQIIVLSKSASQWGVLGPYELRDEYGRLHESIYQFQKLYPKTRPAEEKYPLGKYGQVIWTHPSETHLIQQNGQWLVTPEYTEWRKKGLYMTKPVRFPNTKAGAKDCVCSLPETSPILPTDNYAEVVSKLGPPLNYIQARKQIYAKEYLRLVRKQPKFTELVSMLQSTDHPAPRLLIIEVDGPHQESLPYYQEKYGVSSNFIEQHSIEATAENLRILLNDPKHPFGHGYCLAMALLNLDHLLD